MKKTQSNSSLQKSNPQVLLTIGYLYRKASKYRLLFILSFVFIPLAQLSGQILSPLILARVLDRLSRQAYIPNDIWGSFGNEIILFAIAVLMPGLVLWRLGDAVIWRLEGKVTRDISQQVYNHLMNHSSSFHANNFGGSLVSNTNKLIGSYIRIADTTFYGLVPLVFNVLASAAVLFSRAPQFSIGLILFSLVYIVIAYTVSKPVRRAGTEHSIQESSQTGYLADSITNVLTIKSFAKLKREGQEFARQTEKTRSTLMKLMNRNQVQMAYFGGLNGVLKIGSLVSAIVAVIVLGSDIAVAFLIFNYTATIVDALFNFSNTALRSYNRAIGDSSEMIRILNTEPEIKDIKDPETSRILRGEIVLNDVHFKHNDSRGYLFEGLNLKIKPGEKVGLVGRSGSGKTTLTKLLLRFSDINDGAILIDNQDISKITQDSLRESIAHVPQEPMLFHRTIAENIGYSRDNPSKKEIIAIAKESNAHEFIDQLPKGYDTLVGERGVKLSGGQRQRVAIARAMLKNAPILLLDEATSALDSESEELIQEALWRLMEGRTAIVIAHRLSTIQKMDRIIVMDDGKIIEEGTHKELVRQDGAYANLWYRQSGGFIES